MVAREDWLKEGATKFGDDRMGWRFVCPSCSHVACVRDWLDAGAPETAVAFSCIGRWTGASGDQAFKKAGGPCNYAGGGLFKLNPISVEHDGIVHNIFAFAD